MPDQGSAATEHAILQEITGPLEALPDDPLAIINAEFPTALRGYDRLAVDEYVRRTRQLVAELQATRSPESAVRRALERVGDEITGILQRAHETAEQITSQSRSEAEDRLEQARQEAAQIIAAAEQRVRDLDADTDRIWLERQRIVGDAEELAAQLQSLAKSALERFPADTGAEAAESAPTAAPSGVAQAAPVPFGAGEEDEYLDEAPDLPAEQDADADETVPFHPVGSPGPEQAEPESAAAAGAHAEPYDEEPESDDQEPEPDGEERDSHDAEPEPDDEAGRGEQPTGGGESSFGGESTSGGESPSGAGPASAGEPASENDTPSAGADARSGRGEGPGREGPGGAGSGGEGPGGVGPRGEGPSTDDDTTAVIPPASEAGSRRLSQ